MNFKVTVRPSGREFVVEGSETVLAAALRAGVGLPYGCKNGACGICKGKVVDGERRTTAAPAARADAGREGQGHGAVLLRAAVSDIVIEAREVVGIGDIPIRKMPCRLTAIERPTADVAIVTLQLPANERCSTAPASTSNSCCATAAAQLQHGQRAAPRRADRAAHPPHAGRRVHRRVFGAKEPPVKERDILRFEGPLGTFFLREDNPTSRSCCWPAAPASRRSRRSSSTSSTSA